MNSQTQRKLLEFVKAVEEALAASEQAHRVVREKGQELSDALKHDETIVEVS